ncbi:hypothetical protein [Arthrobacter sp. StoSoilB13]|uniref:hypothetical protein n=1 Tax=Arthrobacter sp. StoSoilB13 TaxID=2830993 RepID=UPI001CC5FB72|nr:hypothetical protein [Arthrobacter sp. StoSoilB13]BCW47948.1 hypothetical protein StoSoilB13_02900 [Arthrobacter sp. StoSoilB13]
MNTLTAPAARPEPGEVMREYFQAATCLGRRSTTWKFLRFGEEFLTYVELGRHIPAGQGRHRESPYNSAYNVVEDGRRDQLKARLMGRRSDWVLRA